MGIDAATRSAAGGLVAPSSDQDWQDWVSATATRNFLLQDTLLDWLDLYGEENGFKRDSDLPNYDPRTDFTKFIFQKTGEFEAAVIAHLKTLTTVTTIAFSPADTRKIEKIQETFVVIESGAPKAKEEDGETALEALHDLHLETKPPELNLLRKANAIAWAYKITIYDALYVALAEQLGYPLVTADEVMLKKLKGHSIVIYLREFKF